MKSGSLTYTKVLLDESENEKRHWKLFCIKSSSFYSRNDMLRNFQIGTKYLKMFCFQFLIILFQNQNIPMQYCHPHSNTFYLVQY